MNVGRASVVSQVSITDLPLPPLSLLLHNFPTSLIR